MIFSWDPGNVTGLAIGDMAGNLIHLEQFTESQLYEYLSHISTADTFIIEEFRIRSAKAQSFSWSDMPVLQAVGALKFRAFQIGAKVVMQPPTFKTAGYRWAGITPPKNHDLSHSSDAYAHLVYHWVKVLDLPSPYEKRTSDNESRSTNS